jgi:hypothetical protein
MITPAGVVAGSTGSTFSITGNNMLFTSDGLVWFIDSKGSYDAVVGLQVSSMSTPTQAVRFLAQGGLGWDGYSTLTFVPQAQTSLGSALLTVDNNLSSLSYGTRMLTGMPIAAGSATLTQWGTQGGDAQHRQSLKTQ